MSWEESIAARLAAIRAESRWRTPRPFDAAGPAGLLEGPAFTKPASWRGLDVPPVLLSGDHGQIAGWRAERSRERTAQRRPDLL